MQPNQPPNPGGGSGPTNPSQTTYCERCELSFPSFAAFHQHKLKSKRHITCEICSQDFSTYDAAKQHHDQMHAHEQDLECPGCNTRFSRLGGLISHLELTECRAIPKESFSVALKGKNDWTRNYQEAHNFQDFSRGGDRDDGPNPFAKPATKGMAAEMFQPQPATYVEDNLISFDDPSAILNSGWGPIHTKPAPAFDKYDFPALGATAPTLATKSQGSVQTTASIPPAAPMNLTERVSTMSISDLASNPYDPDSIGFDIKKYWISFTRKYKCPYLGCNKSMERPAAFIQHLKSPAHRNEKLLCNRCLRYFATATALTQHSESQGVRCKIRESENYGGVVDRITAGTATTAGRHADDTVKYALQADMNPANGAKAIIEANRQQGRDIANARENYWKTHTPKW